MLIYTLVSKLNFSATYRFSAKASEQIKDGFKTDDVWRVKPVTFSYSLLPLILLFYSAV